MAGYIGKGQPLVSNGAERKFKYVATAGQTTFNATYSVGSVHVYRTGVRLTDGVDYTATNGSSVTLTTGCNAGDDVVIVSTSGFQVADAFTKAESYDKTEVDGMIPTLSTLSIANHENIVVDSAGRVTMPYQPSFNAYNPPVTAADNDITNWGATRSNVGGHFNTTTGLFTAPVSGVYFFTFAILVRYNASSLYHRIIFKVNGSASTRFGDTLENQAGPNYSSASMSMSIYLNAGDTVGIRTEGSETYGDSYGSFSGHLVG